MSGTRLIAWLGWISALLSACGGSGGSHSKVDFSADPKAFEAGVVRNEVLIQTDGSRTVFEIAKDLEALGVVRSSNDPPTAHPNAEIVSQLIAGTNEVWTTQKLHQCVQIISNTFRIRTLGKIDISEIKKKLPYVISIEPHLVYNSEIFSKKLSDKFKDENQAMRQLKEELYSSKSNGELYSSKYAPDPYNVYLWGFNSKTEVIRSDQTGKPDPYLVRSSTLSSAGERYDIHLEEALAELNQTLTPTLVAVVDSGVDFSHPDLQQAIAHNPGETGEWKDAPANSDCKDLNCNGIDDDGNGFVDDWRGFNFVSNSNSPSDDNGHGTHVAGIVAADFDGQGISGVNPAARVIPVKVLNEEGLASNQQVLNGVAYAVARGAKVINLSLGGASRSPLAEKLFECVYKNGVLVVAAAGNNNNDLPYYPASYANVLSIGATNFQGEKSYFSNYSSDVDLSAPGEMILSTWPTSRVNQDEFENIYDSNLKQYASLNGTSMATPIIAGVASLLWSWKPDLGINEVTQRILSSSNEAKKPRVLNAHLALKQKPGPFFQVRHGQRLHAEMIDRFAFQKKTTTMKWKVENIGSAVTVRSMHLSSSNDHLSVEGFRSTQNGADWNIEADLSWNGPWEQKTDIPLFLKIETDMGSHQTKLHFQLRPFLQAFPLQANEDRLPRNEDWSPEAFGWGVQNEIVKLPSGEEALWIVGYLVAQDNSRQVYMGLTDQNGNYLEGWPVHFTAAGQLPDHFAKPIYNEKGSPEFVFFSASQSQDKKEPFQRGLYRLNFKAEVQNFISFPGKVFQVHTWKSNAGIRTAVLTKKTHQSFEWQIFNEYDQLLFQQAVSVWDSDSAKLTLCENADGFQEPFFVENRFSAVPNPVGDFDLVAESYGYFLDSAGQTFQELNIPDEEIAAIQCAKNSKNQKELLVQTKKPNTLGKMVLRSYVETLRAQALEWSHSWALAHEGYRGNPMPSVFLLRKNNHTQTVVALNTSFQSMTVLDIETGQPLPGFPIHAPKNRLQQYFMNQAGVVDVDGDGTDEILISEAREKAYLFNQNGTLKSSFRLTGNFLSLPRTFSESRKIFYWVSNQGLQRWTI